MLSCKWGIHSTPLAPKPQGQSRIKDPNNYKRQRQWRATGKQSQQDKGTYNLTVVAAGCVSSPQDQARQKSQHREARHSQSPTPS